jgi:hypothetical protein
MRSFAARADENSEARNRTRRASLVLPRDPRDLMIRADVDQIGGAPVGGVVSNCVAGSVGVCVRADAMYPVGWRP